MAWQQNLFLNETVTDTRMKAVVKLIWTVFSNRCNH
jgi:hypothetical protein